MAKLDPQPRLTTVAADVIEWARNVARNFNLLVDAVGNNGSPRAGTTSISDTLDGPAFGAYRATSQTGLSTGVETVIVFDTKKFDTAGAYDVATGKFQPQVAGWYQLNASVQVDSSTPMTNYQLQFWKNGAMERRTAIFLDGSPGNSMVAGSALIYLNGTTDYAQVAVLCTGATSPQTTGGTGYSSVCFEGYLARRN